MLAQPLWIGPAPSDVQDDWQQLSAQLRARAGEHWEVWIDRYEARLAGRIHLWEEDEVARVSLPNGVWNKGRLRPTPVFQAPSA